MKAGKNTPASVLAYIDAIWLRHQVDPLELAAALGYDAKATEHLAEKHGGNLVPYLLSVQRRRTEQPRLLGRRLGYTHNLAGAIATRERGADGVETEPEAVPESYDNVVRMQSRNREADRLAEIRADRAEQMTRDDIKRVHARFKALMLDEVRSGRDPTILLGELDRLMADHERQSRNAA